MTDNSDNYFKLAKPGPPLRDYKDAPPLMPESPTDYLVNEGLVRTDMSCHNCSKTFIAELDYSINGEHEAQCPHCNHSHYRAIKDGVITGERWDTDLGANDPKKIPARRVWKSGVLVMQTSTAAEFIRQRWLDR